LLISENYRDLNRALHETNAAYGTSGGKWAGAVHILAQSTKARSVLDYGAGKGTLKASLPATPAYQFREYDPAVEEISAAPEPADLVVCTDVLEHIEPIALDEVLDHLRNLTLTGAFLVVATMPAKKFLADGRNAHLIVQPLRWWLDRIMDRWPLRQLNASDGEFIAVVGR
jgi:2-polyprenyl-3-methyl-5-hydroxy-6-metoxy-1,4-benzoquinol methylase